MSYLVLARRYRPKEFGEVIGQPHVVTTLSNAIEMDRLSHAYLFAGPRGTGKTSVARILAKCLNCEGGISKRPCNKCSTCLEISEGISLDVMEIDGASNRGIDEIRALREEIRFSPAKSPYKIYIIDEVHMLTEPAFNALLKTLEEPPSHAIFIFATTDPYRIPQTILSRTQRFDFRRLQPKEIAHFLRNLAKKEGLRMEDKAVDLVARRSDGSMRDALTILDQLIAYSGEEIRVSDVFQVLGIPPIEKMLRLCETIHLKDLKGAMSLVSELVDEGQDLGHFIKELLTHLRNLLLLSYVGEDGVVDLPNEEISLMMNQANEFGQYRLIEVIEELGRVAQEMRYSSNQRLLLEMGLIRLITKDKAHSLEGIYKEIVDLEERLREGPIVREVEAEQAEIPKRPCLEDIRKVWPSLLNAMKMKRPTLASCLEQGEVVGIEKGRLVIGFRSIFQRDTCEKPQNKEEVEDEIERIIGNRIETKMILIPKEDDEGVLLEMEPMVKRAIEIFGGEIKEVKDSRG